MLSIISSLDFYTSTIHWISLEPYEQISASLGYKLIRKSPDETVPGVPASLVSKYIGLTRLVTLLRMLYVDYQLWSLVMLDSRVVKSF